MKLLKNGQLRDDPYRTLGPEEPVPADGSWMIPWQRWLAEGATFPSRPGLTLGLRVPGETRVEDVAAAVKTAELAAIAIVFPAFRDGRGFSLARLLRDRAGFTGELRAEGPLLPDQYAFLVRCGFDAVALNDPTRLPDWERCLTQVDVVYQPAADRRPSVLALRQGGTAPTDAAAAQ